MVISIKHIAAAVVMAAAVCVGIKLAADRAEKPVFNSERNFKVILDAGHGT